jgi:hypothetical protein
VTGVDELAEQARASIDELRQAWAWLRLLAEPGRESSTALVVDDAQAERLAALGMQAKAYRTWNLRWGLSALAPTPAAARIGVLDAQVAVHGLVLDVARAVATAAHSTYVGARSGADAVLDALDWLEEGPRPYPWVCGPEGPRWRAGALDRLRDPAAAAAAAGLLQRANRLAREACRVVDADPVRPLEHRCPACRAQSLQLHYDGEDLARVADGARPRNVSRWYAECVSQRCRCTVQGCGCGMRSRIDGRRHAWAYGELPDLWRAIERAAQIRGRPVGSAAEGHGWGIIGA